MSLNWRPKNTFEATQIIDDRYGPMLGLANGIVFSLKLRILINKHLNVNTLLHI